MQELAIQPEQRLNAPQGSAKPTKHRISRKVMQAIELLATGECKTQKAAAARVNITPEWLCKQLAREQVTAVMRERMTRGISVAGLRAATRMAELIDAESEKVSHSAAAFILGVEGLAPKQHGGITINNNVQAAGYVINLATKAEQQPAIDITPERGVSGGVSETTG
jgi:hypothetical protein